MTSGRSLRAMRGFTWTRMKSGSDTPVLITGVNASDSDNEDITYSLFEAPAGFSIDEVTGRGNLQRAVKRVA